MTAATLPSPQSSERSSRRPDPGRRQVGSTTVRNPAAQLAFQNTRPSFEDQLRLTERKRRKARVAADQVAIQLVESLRSEDWTDRDVELVIASTVTWLPQLAPSLKARWSELPDRLAASPASQARSLLARWQFRELFAQELYFLAEALFSALPLEQRDPLSVVSTLHVYFMALKQMRLGMEDLPRDLQLKVQRSVSFLRLHLGSGDYRQGTPYCASPELLLCLISELWRETVPLAAELRLSLEQAIRWELEVEAAVTPLSCATLTIAAENLHLKGVDPREQRMELMALQGPTGDYAPTIFRRPDGSVFAAGHLLNQMFIARALAGQPRTGRAA